MEIMSPAGSFESLMAAIKAGANSIYFGVEQLNMRSRSANFKLKDLKEIVKRCKKNNVKTYLALNTIIYDNDIKQMQKICQEAKKQKITAIIATDIATMEFARSINLEVHASTQLNISNLEAVKFFSKYCDVIVLARELTLNQIKHITKEIKKQKIKGPNKKLLKIEIFCHGALCVSISGKCYMSLAKYNFSANRGACLQPCRREYKVTDEETGEELKIDNKFIMSPKDLCTIEFLDKIINSGIDILKIEGRARSPEYVYTVTKVYKEAITSIKNKTYTKEKIKKWNKELKEVYNRGFWQGGYYLGKKLGEWSGLYGSKATKTKTYIGKITNYFVKPSIAEIKIEAGTLNKNNEILITGNTTGILKLKAKKIIKDEKEIKKAKKKDIITIKVPERVRKNDKVYLNENKI